MWNETRSPWTILRKYCKYFKFSLKTYVEKYRNHFQVVVQYDKDLLEVWDEAKRLRCEWFNDYEKTASKPPMVIADLDVIQLDFRGDNVDCWMEIQHGKGPWAPPVTGIVPIGSTLTLVVAINDFRGEMILIFFHSMVTSMTMIYYPQPNTNNKHVSPFQVSSI